MRICTVTGNKEKGVKIMPRPYLGDPKYTIEVLQKYNFAFQKRFGQNFLIDTHVLDKIIDSAQITKDDFVLEIGPGIGTMTQYLAEAAREVAAVEIDKTLLPILDDTLKDWDNVTVINNDILKVDIRQLALEKNQCLPSLVKRCSDNTKHQLLILYLNRRFFISFQSDHRTSHFRSWHKTVGRYICHDLWFRIILHSQ